MALLYGMRLTANDDAVCETQQLSGVSDTGLEEHIVNVYPDVEYQTFRGFGCALTEASGIVLDRLGRQNADRVLDRCFGPDGLRYRYVRVSLDSCDFSSGPYSAVEDPCDTTFSTFSMEHDRLHVIPWILRASQVAGRPLSVMLSPWSPPWFMKTNSDRMGGGHLLLSRRRDWAEYIATYVRAYRDAGVFVTAVSVQNEPNAVQRWDSCLYDASEERTFLCDFLYPALQRHGLEDVRIYIWDHNKERLFDRISAEMDERSNPMIAGAAFHWYSGDHFDAVRMVHERFSDKHLVFSEGCIEFSRQSPEKLAEHAVQYGHEIIGNLNAGMDVFLDWNMILDAEGGPNHAGNFCEAPIMALQDFSSVRYNPSYHCLRQFCRHIDAGSLRIGTTSYDRDLEVTALRNPSGSVVTVLLNESERAKPVRLRIGGKLYPFRLEGRSVATVVL